MIYQSDLLGINANHYKNKMFSEYTEKWAAVVLFSEDGSDFTPQGLTDVCIKCYGSSSSEVWKKLFDAVKLDVKSAVSDDPKNFTHLEPEIWDDDYSKWTFPEDSDTVEQFLEAIYGKVEILVCRIG